MDVGSRYIPAHAPDIFHFPAVPDAGTRSQSRGAPRRLDRGADARATIYVDQALNRPLAPGITLKNVPQSVYRVIKREAKRKRRSLNAEIVQTLDMEAAEAERRRQLGHLRKELGFAASLPPLDDSTPLIRRDRER